MEGDVIVIADAGAGARLHLQAGVEAAAVAAVDDDVEVAVVGLERDVVVVVDGRAGAGRQAQAGVPIGRAAEVNTAGRTGAVGALEGDVPLGIDFRAGPSATVEPVDSTDSLSSMVQSLPSVAPRNAVERPAMLGLVPYLEVAVV